MHRANLTIYRLIRSLTKFVLRVINLTPKHFLYNTLLFYPFHHFSRIFIEISQLVNKTEWGSTRNQAGSVTNRYFCLNTVFDI